MTGHYFECDHCHAKDFSQEPPVGWIGMSQVVALRAPQGLDPRDQGDPSEPSAGVKEMHACSLACAINLLSPVTAPTVH